MSDTLNLFVCPVTDTVESECRTLCDLLQRVLPDVRVSVSFEARIVPQNLAAVRRRLARESTPTVAVMALPPDSELVRRFRDTLVEFDPETSELPTARLMPVLVRGEGSPWSPEDRMLRLDRAGVRRLVADVGRLTEVRPAKLLSAFEAAWPDAERELVGHVHAADLRRAHREGDPRGHRDRVDEDADPCEVVRIAVRDLVPTFTVTTDPDGVGVAVSTAVPAAGQEVARAVHVIKETLALHGLHHTQVRLTAPLRMPGGVFLPPILVSFDGSLWPRRTSSGFG